MVLIPTTQVRAHSPLQSVTYLVVMREQNPAILNEFFHSLASLRRFHPELPVFVYHDNLEPAHLAMIEEKPNVMAFAIGVDRSGRYERNNYKETFGWVFPELHVLSCKVDCLLLTPGSTLFLDSDTEVMQPLDEIFSHQEIWMHKDEGLMVEQERNLNSVLDNVDWGAWGWQGDVSQLRMYNSGVIYVPIALKVHLYRAKEFTWSLARLPAEDRGDNRLDEQFAVSLALQEATNYRVREADHLVDHYWQEKYNSPVQRYLQYV